jgi:hypothetical protein
MGAVVAHENEHVTHNAAKADQEGMVAHSSVSLHYAMCPECGRMYVSGGTTQTSYTPKQKADESGKGGNVNTFA